MADCMTTFRSFSFILLKVTASLVTKIFISPVSVLYTGLTYHFVAACQAHISQDDRANLALANIAYGRNARDKYHSINALTAIQE